MTKEQRIAQLEEQIQQKIQALEETQENMIEHVTMENGFTRIDDEDAHDRLATQSNELVNEIEELEFEYHELNGLKVEPEEREEEFDLN